MDVRGRRVLRGLEKYYPVFRDGSGVGRQIQGGIDLLPVKLPAEVVEEDVFPFNAKVL